jgi:uncharacterized protein YqeY
LIAGALAAGAQSVGAVMGKLAPQIKGRFDGKEANRLVQEALKK